MRRLLLTGTALLALLLGSAAPAFAAHHDTARDRGCATAAAAVAGTPGAAAVAAACAR